MQSDRREFVKGAAAALAVPLVHGVSRAIADEKTTRPRIKLGQIGVGHAHANKLEAFRQSGDYEIVGIVEPDAELRKRAESDKIYSGLKWMTQEQLLNVSGLQAVLVETRVRDLLNAAEACVMAGKHVHLDKPAGESLPQYRRILDAARRQQLLVQMGYMFRYNPGVVLLRDFLKRGWLGEVFEVHGVMSKQIDPASRRRFGEYRGGMMFELGCHMIDLVVGTLGKPTKITPVARHSAELKDPLLDNMLAVLEYPRALATVKSSALEVEGFDRRHFTVCGSEGTFHIQPLDEPSARVAISTARGSYKKGYQTISFPKYTRYVDDAADMARVIRGEKPTDFPYEHDLAVQTAVLEASGLPTG